MSQTKPLCQIINCSLFAKKEVPVDFYGLPAYIFICQSHYDEGQFIGEGVDID